MTTAFAAPTGEVQNISGTRLELARFDAAAARFLGSAEAATAIAARVRAAAAALLAHADQLEAEMAGREVDSQTVAAVAEMREQAAALLAAAERLDNAAGGVASAAEGLRAASATALHGINSRHSAVEEATLATPEGGAVKDYYTD